MIVYIYIYVCVCVCVCVYDAYTHNKGWIIILRELKQREKKNDIVLDLNIVVTVTERFCYLTLWCWGMYKRLLGKTCIHTSSVIFKINMVSIQLGFSFITAITRWRHQSVSFCVAIYSDFMKNWIIIYGREIFS